MSGEDEEVPDDDPPASTDGDRLEQKRKELDQRKRGLDDFAEELDAREATLDERERGLEDREEQLDQRSAALDEREATIEERESELDDRAVAIGERERELSGRTEELDAQEATLHQYVDETVQGAVEEGLSGVSFGEESTGRFGRIGSVLLALVGVLLVVGGVLFAFSGEIALVPPVVRNDTANLALSVLLLFVGLAANLAAVAD